MPNQNISNNTLKTYKAGDMVDAYAVAECDMRWMNTAISHISEKIKTLHTLTQNGETISQYHFSELVTHLDMYEYLAEERCRCHAEERERYEAEWEANKKAVSL